MRYTPENITELEDNEVFVFGSNKEGNHAGGAARTAVEKFGAVMGQGHGPRGQSYAIPTMGSGGNIATNVYKFLDFAKEHRDLTFLVTKVGCGIAGRDEKWMASLFQDASNNVIKPKGW